MASVNKIKKFGIEYDIEDIRANPENIVTAVNNAINNGEIEVGGEPYDASFLKDEQGNWVDSIGSEQAQELAKHTSIKVEENDPNAYYESHIFVQTYCTLDEGVYFEQVSEGICHTLNIAYGGTVQHWEHDLRNTSPLDCSWRSTWRIITPTEQSAQQYQYPFEGPGIYTIELCDSEQYGRVYTATLVVPVSYQATCFKTFYSTPIVANTTGCLRLYPVVDGDIVTNNWLSWADISFPANPVKIRIIKIATLPQTIL